MTAHKIAWNVGAVAVGVLIGLWLYVTCSTDLAPRSFDRCVVSHMLAVLGIALFVGAAVLVLRTRGGR